MKKNIGIKVKILDDGDKINYNKKTKMYSGVIKNPGGKDIRWKSTSKLIWKW